MKKERLAGCQGSSESTERGTEWEEEWEVKEGWVAGQEARVAQTGGLEEYAIRGGGEGGSEGGKEREGEAGGEGVIMM